MNFFGWNHKTPVHIFIQNKLVYYRCSDIIFIKNWICFNFRWESWMGNSCPYVFIFYGMTLYLRGETMDIGPVYIRVLIGTPDLPEPILYIPLYSSYQLRMDLKMKLIRVTRRNDLSFECQMTFKPQIRDKFYGTITKQNHWKFVIWQTFRLLLSSTLP